MMSSKEMEHINYAAFVLSFGLCRCIVGSLKLNNILKAVAGRSLSKPLSVYPGVGLFRIVGAGGSI